MESARILIVEDETIIAMEKAEKILSDFILLGIIEYEGTEKGIYYRLSEEFSVSG